MTRSTVTLVVASLLLAPRLLNAENIRGPVAEQLAVGAKPDRAAVGIGDLVALGLGENSRFLNGVEIRVDIPPQARRYRDLLALFVYKSVAPQPSAASSAYEATPEGFAVLSAATRAFVDIPIVADSIEPSADATVLQAPVRVDEFPLLLSVAPLTKALPGSATSIRFTVSATPIFQDRGLLRLTIEAGGKPPSMPFSLSIDDQPTPYPLEDGGLVLSSGIHHLRVDSDSYREEFQTFGIDQGGTTSIDIALVRPVSRLIFEAPRGTEVELDGTGIGLVPLLPVDVSEGEHTIVFRVGNYTLTKNVIVQRGKSYKISLFLDILVEEN